MALIFCSWDPPTNYETTKILHFYQFDQINTGLDQTKNFVKKNRENSGYVVSELVAGCNEQDIQSICDMFS